MYTDLLPIPSRGLFYPKDKYGKNNEYIEVAHLTTEDEMMLTSPNLFAKGDALYRLLERKIKPYNDFISVDDLLVYDKDFIVLWLRENAYGNLIEDVNTDNIVTFNTHDMAITYLDIPPNEDLTYNYMVDGKIFKIKPVTYFQERRDSLKKDKLKFYCSNIVDVDGHTDPLYIRNLVGKMLIPKSRELKKRIDRITFGVNTKTFYTENYVKKDTIIELDELFFGFNQTNLHKMRETLQSSIFFLQNEGQGYTKSDIMNMTTYDRLYHLDRLSDKIKKINEDLKK